MNTPVTPTPNTPPKALPTPADLLVALDRMLTVGSYYSADHERTVAVAVAVREALLGVAGDADEVTISWSAEGFSVCGELVDSTKLHTRKLTDVMSAVGVGCLAIATTATDFDLREASRVLQANRHALSGATGLTEMKWDQLPDTVRVAENSMRLAALPDEIPEALADIPQKSVELPELDPGVILPTGDATIRPEESGAMTDADQIAAAVSLADAARRLTESPDLVDLVFGQLRRRNRPEEEPAKKDNAPPKPDRKPATFEYSLDEFMGEVANLEKAPPDERHAGATTRAEYFGVCLQALKLPEHVGTTEVIAGMRREFASEKLQASERQVVLDGLADLCATVPVEIADLALTTVRDGLRERDPMSLAAMWLALWRDGDEPRRTVLHPHVLASLLDGLESVDKEALSELWRAASAFDIADVATKVPRFEALLGGGTRRIPPSIWVVPPLEMAPLHALLLKSRIAETLGPQLHHRLSLGTDGSLPVVLMDLMEDYESRRHDLYVALISEPTSGKPTAELARLAAKVLHHTLNRLPGDDRDRPCIPAALTWYQRLHPRGAQPLLERIISERQLWFWPVWPSRCRETAERLLKATNVVGATQAEDTDLE